MSAAQLLEIYKAFYADKPFVRVFDNTAAIGTAQVSGTNFCNLIVDVDERNNRLRVISHIDNLMDRPRFPRQVPVVSKGWKLFRLSAAKP